MSPRHDQQSRYNANVIKTGTHLAIRFQLEAKWFDIHSLNIIHIFELNES